MKRSPRILFVTSCLAGLLAGYGAKRASRVEGSSAQAVASLTQTTQNESLPSSPEEAAAILAKISASRPSDTLESLKADGTNLYPRLAQWLLHATPAEVAAYWEHFLKKPVQERDDPTIQLIFQNWARLDAQAMMAAAKGAKMEIQGWQALANHDPAAALAAVPPDDEEALGMLGSAIGHYRPEWLREHYDSLPETLRDDAARNLGGTGDDAAANLAFLHKNGLKGQRWAFSRLASQDPWAAYDWLQKHGSRLLGEDSSGDLQSSFIATVGREHPEVLAQIAASTPPGGAKREMEAVLFDKLVKDDPEAALKQAQENKAPVIALEQMAKVGIALEGTDRERIFTLAGEMLKLRPELTQGGQVLIYDNGSSESRDPTTEATGEFARRLVDLDPERAMDLFVANDATTTMQTLGRTWMSRDAAAYADWVERLSDPQVRDSAVGPLISNLVSKKEYSAAADWAKSTSTPSQQLQMVIQGWQRADAEGARAWVDQAGLPEETRQKLEPIFNRKR